ncbi:hypothetical protein DID88_009487 [Monilinia fructigena]|uniref:Uncharacterized protein n=1 Tax=Monilinia fructigena TaxID=38457 RepID=A0A395IMH7_9HELO|nr:hypothetical protein DID88_009487 [Monilinia fructigena]
MYGMSPGPQYGNVAPVFPQPIPNQMPMAGGYGAPNQFGTSPQAHYALRNQHNPNAPNYNGYRPFQTAWSTSTWSTKQSIQRSKLLDPSHSFDLDQWWLVDDWPMD